VGVSLIRVLVLNPGSATLKLALAECHGDEVTVHVRASVEWDATTDRDSLLGSALSRLTTGATPDTIGLRVVHGGDRLTRPTLVDPDVEAEIERCRPLAPFHNGAALDLLAAVRRRFPAVPVVAVFDTAFHAARAPASMRYALPPEIDSDFPIRRYGFHGIAHHALANALARETGVEQAAVDAVTLQLGAGCSACAISAGRSVETSMGFTPLEGLVMATRSGDVDPGLVLRLVRRRSPDEVEDLLRRRSGLLGLAGTADMRRVLERVAAGDPDASLAVEIFVRRVVATVGAYLTLLEGRGAIVFGGGIGAGSAEIRSRVAARLAVWGVRLDPRRNARGAPGPVHASGSRPVWTFETDEEEGIAAQAASVVGPDSVR
jgi:acetate kinase